MNASSPAAYLRQHGVRKTLARAWSHATQTCEMLALNALRKPVVRTRYGVRMRANWNDATFRFCYFGSYGRALSDFLDNYPEPFVYLDIGANQGLYSLVAARNPHCRTVLAFEPVPSTFELLNANVQLNADTQAKVRCIKAGIASERRSQDIFIDPRHSGLSSLNRNHAQQGVTQTIELITHREVDALLQQHAPDCLGLVVKIDVEGYEEIVAAQLMKLACSERLQSVFYEVDERWTNQSALKSMFEINGFRGFMTFVAGTHYDVLATRQPGRADSLHGAATA